jgi:hypothetical protein
MNYNSATIHINCLVFNDIVLQLVLFLLYLRFYIY